MNIFDKYFNYETMGIGADENSFQFNDVTFLDDFYSFKKGDAISWIYFNFDSGIYIYEDSSGEQFRGEIVVQLGEPKKYSNISLTK
jgi:hypothetical protein